MAREFVKDYPNGTAAEFIAHAKTKNSKVNEGTAKTTFYNQKGGGTTAKKKRVAVKKRSGDVGGNPGISIAAIMFIKQVGSIGAAIKELQAFEKVLGDGTLPF